MSTKFTPIVLCRTRTSSAHGETSPMVSGLSMSGPPGAVRMMAIGMRQLLFGYMITDPPPNKFGISSLLLCNYAPMIDWQDLVHFACLSRAGSLSAAARELGVDHATVGRRIASLEQALGLHLVDRL